MTLTRESVAAVKEGTASEATVKIARPWGVVGAGKGALPITLTFRSNSL